MDPKGSGKQKESLEDLLKRFDQTKHGGELMVPGFVSEDEVNILRRATEVFGDTDAAYHWLMHPVRSLGGVTPISLIGTHEGVQLVMDDLGGIEAGLPA